MTVFQRVAKLLTWSGAICLASLSCVVFFQTHSPNGLGQPRDAMGPVPSEGDATRASLVIEERSRLSETPDSVEQASVDPPSPSHLMEMGLAEQALLLHERQRAEELLGLLGESWLGQRRKVPAEIARPPLALGDVQSLLDGDTALLEFMLGEGESYLWVVTEDSFASFTLPDRAYIERSVDRWRNRLHGGLPTLVVSADLEARHLSDVLLSPATRALDKSRVVIIPDGALHSVPFSALPDPRMDNRGDSIPLAANHEIVMMPSVAVLAAQRHSRQPRDPTATEIAVVADAVYAADDPRITNAEPESLESVFARSRERLMPESASRHLFPVDRLPYSGLEARAIAALVPESESVLALGFDANRETIMSGTISHSRVIHFATHARIDGERPGLSGLVVSLIDEEGRARNGLLTRRDILSLNLAADLVVLSGCDTALGIDHRDEGLTSLSQSFLAAGGRQVVASLWSVDDTVTAAFMQHFYRAMLEAGASPTAALREAQSALRREPRWRSPYYWAAFTIQGDWQGSKR